MRGGRMVKTILGHQRVGDNYGSLGLQQALALSSWETGKGVFASGF